MQQGDDPPYLQVGTAVSAKYKGAFCEAKVSNVVRNLKCKVTFKMGLGTATLGDEHIEGNLLRVGQLVQARHPEKREFLDAIITKIQDCSQYTVVFDDGDITTLRRTALCLKSGRHFNESETLDQLPLTHPEHFGNPVVGGRRGRRSRQLKEDSSDGEGEEETEPDLELYTGEIGRVVSIETSDKKRNKDNWFPGLIVMPSAQPTVRINMKDEYLIRSFKDGRYYTVPKKEVSEFNRELGSRVESSVLGEAVDKALKYLDNDELPVHWERSTLFNSQPQYSDSEENYTDSSDDEPREEKDHFVAQLYKFMDDSGTPLNKNPMIGNEHVDLYRLFRVVEKLGGYNRVTNQNKWRSVTMRLKFPDNQNTFNQVKSVYKKCLFSYEPFYRTLGCTMLNHPRNAKKNRGRPLIRDKDRATPVQSPRPEKEEEEKKEEEDKSKKKEIKIKEEEKKKVESDTSSSSDATDQSEIPSTSKEVAKPKRVETKGKKFKKITGDKVKTLIERFEEQSKKEEVVEKDDKVVQLTRSKSQASRKEAASPDSKAREPKTPVKDPVAAAKLARTIKKSEEDKKRGRKRIILDEKASNSDNSTDTSVVTVPSVNIGDKLKVYYGPTHESKVTYEAKVIEIDREAMGPIYLVHYTGWNTRYDEWIVPARIAENLSATTKAKRLKQGSGGVTGTPGKASTSKPATKRGRGMSITGRSTVQEAPRSTTPSSVTSSSSRTKSPATPATRGTSRLTRQGDWGRRTRRSSVQTDASMQSEYESDTSISEAESTKSKSGSKTEENDMKQMKKKLTKQKIEKKKEDDDTEKEDEIEKPKRIKKLKKHPEVKQSPDVSDEDNSNPPKGRILDLNEIRSELKGINKAVKINTESTSEKEALSSDESVSLSESKPVIDKMDDKKDIDKSSSSEDIYEFKEPEPFEFESRKVVDDKLKKRFVPRVLEDIDKSPRKKIAKSPIKLEPKEFAETEKRRYRRTPVKKQEEIEEEIKKDNEESGLSLEDPFDKLVESPSFTHIGKSSERPEDVVKVVKKLNLDEPLSLFSDLPESTEDEEEKLDISDNEEIVNEPYFSNKQQLFTDSNFSNDSPTHIIETECIPFVMKPGDESKKESDDEDTLRTIHQVIDQTSLDDDSNDGLLLNKSPLNFPTKKEEPISIASNTLEELTSDDQMKSEIDTEPELEAVDEKEIKNKLTTLSKQIAPVFQETDSSLLEEMCASPEILSKPDLKDIHLKTGPKIADSILQKFNLIKKETPKKEEEQSPQQKPETKPDIPETKPEPIIETKPINTIKTLEIKSKSPEIKLKVESKPKPPEIKPETDKKRSSRKIVSREFIEETDSDSDSSDSEQRLIIARSDEDTQTSASMIEIKNEKCEIIENVPPLVVESNAEAIVEEKRNFKIDVEPELPEKETLEAEVKHETECVKEDEPDSHIHLLCEETLPRSPAPAPKTKYVLEMPFASAPSSSNKSNMLLINEHSSKPANKERNPSPIQPPEVKHEIVSAVLDNTPPTTPESTISNMSPRDDNEDLSPSHVDNESCKSTEAENDFSTRASTNKITPYSEEDTLMNGELNTSGKKQKEDLPSPCKKRRRSFKGPEDVPTKRGRKPNNRSRHNSDSDDTSEHSMPGNSIGPAANVAARYSRSPGPSKYNFVVEFGPGLDSAQRIAVLQQRLQDLRKTYANVKAELATIERRRKKIRRREREALKAAKQEMSCT